MIMVPRSAPQHTSTDSGLAWLLHLTAAAAAVVLIKSPGPDATCKERAREHEGRRGVSTSHQFTGVSAVVKVFPLVHASAAAERHGGAALLADWRAAKIPWSNEPEGAAAAEADGLGSQRPSRLSGLWIA